MAGQESSEAGQSARLSFRVVLGFAVGSLGQGLLPLIVGSWVLYYYSPPEGKGAILLAPATLGGIRLVERLIGALFEPMAGHLSDQTRTRWGRRKPWIAVGLPVLLVGFVGLWFPPQGLAKDAPQTIVHCAIFLMLFYFGYTSVFAPYNALLPELSRDSEERVRLSTWMALFEVISNIGASLGAAPLIQLGAISVAGIAFANGYQVLAVIAAVVALFSVLPVLIFTKEVTQVEQAPFSLKDAVLASLRNPRFLRYAAAIFGFRMATFSAIVAIPFLATQLMGLEDSEAPLMLAVIILVATFAFPLVQRLSGRYGKATVFRAGGFGFVVVLPLMGTIGWLPISPVWHGATLFLLSGFSVATLFVLPRAILADVIDEDEASTGRRREAMYTGMSGVVEKMGEALATGVVGVLFQTLGNSAARPGGLRFVGLAASLVLMAGLLGFGKPARDAEGTS